MIEEPTSSQGGVVTTHLVTTSGELSFHVLKSWRVRVCYL